MKAMLAGSIDPKQLPKYANNDNWWFQQKVDGIRALFICEGGNVSAYNRNGAPLTKDVPVSVTRCLKPLSQGQTPATSGMKKTVVIDGELVEGVLWVFDLPVFGTAVSLRSSYEDRHQALEIVMKAIECPTVKLLPTAKTTLEKLELAKDVLMSGLEGVIARDKTSPYVPGLRAPTLQKAKFVKDADCVIMAVNLDGKQNMRLGCYDANGTLRSVGECTGLAGDGPTICEKELVGAVVKVRYLSMYKTRLYQPNLPTLRDDKRPEDCTMDQFRTTDRRVLADWKGPNNGA